MKLSVVYLGKNVFEFREEPGYFVFREVVSDFVQRCYFFFGQGDGFIHGYLLFTVFSVPVKCLNGYLFVL